MGGGGGGAGGGGGGGAGPAGAAAAGAGGAPAAGRAWTGQIFLRDEGGYEVVLRALNHYNRRLARIADSPEVAGAGGTLASVLGAEAARVGPLLRPLAGRLRAGLADPAVLASLEGDVGLIERAMACYLADAEKAAGAGAHPYYAALVEGNRHYRGDAAALGDCIRRLKGYSG